MLGEFEAMKRLETAATEELEEARAQSLAGGVAGLRRLLVEQRVQRLQRRKEAATAQRKAAVPRVRAVLQRLERLSQLA